MSRYYQTVCRPEDDAYAAFHATHNLFNHIGEVTGFGRKRYANSVLWRFDDELPIVERMLAALRDTGIVHRDTRDFRGVLLEHQAVCSLTRLEQTKGADAQGFLCL